MKTPLLVFTTLFLIVVSSTARAGDILPMDSPSGVGNCGVVLPPGVPVTIYVLDKFNIGTTGSEWRISNPSEVGVLGVTSSFPFTGDVFTGIKFTYPACLTGSFLLCELTVVNLGLTNCGQLQIVPYTGEDTVLWTDCSGASWYGYGGRFRYNLPTKFCANDCAIPTEPSTWGSVKALYR